MQSVPTVEALKEEYADKLDIRVFNVDENSEAGQVFQSLNGYAVPTFFFIDKDGHISNTMLGFAGDEQLRGSVKQFVEAQQ